MALSVRRIAIRKSIFPDYLSEDKSIPSSKLPELHLLDYLEKKVLTEKLIN